MQNIKGEKERERDMRGRERERRGGRGGEEKKGKKNIVFLKFGNSGN
jgi:hypothetical protein